MIFLWSVRTPKYIRTTTQPLLLLLISLIHWSSCLANSNMLNMYARLLLILMPISYAHNVEVTWGHLSICVFLSCFTTFDRTNAINKIIKWKHSIKFHAIRERIFLFFFFQIETAHLSCHSFVFGLCFVCVLNSNKNNNMYTKKNNANGQWFSSVRALDCRCNVNYIWLRLMKRWRVVT